MKHFRAHFSEPGGVFSIFLTNQCNFVCAHCCTDSGPHDTTQFGLTELLSVLDGLRETPSVHAVHVSGGEPFLALRQLELISERCKADNRLLGVNTNGFWVKSKNICERFDSSLSGISDLFVSFSKWHAQFISPREVSRTIEFARDRGIRVELMLVFEKQSELPDLKEVIPAKYRSEVPISVSVVERLGRAERIRLSPEHNPELRENLGCAEANRPVVMPDGTFLMCCNTVEYSRGTAGLRLGRIGVPGDVAYFLQRHREDVGVRTVRIFGPNLIVALQRSSLAQPESKAATDKCSNCAQLLKSEQGLRELSGYVDRLPNVFLPPSSSQDGETVV